MITITITKDDIHKLVDMCFEGGDRDGRLTCLEIMAKLILSGVKNARAEDKYS